MNGTTSAAREPLFTMYLLQSERIGTISIALLDSNFPPIENPPIYQNQLRVLTILNDDFEIDWDSLYNEFMLSKNRPKRKYFQNNFAQSKKDHV